MFTGNAWPVDTLYKVTFLLYLYYTIIYIILHHIYITQYILYMNSEFAFYFYQNDSGLDFMGSSIGNHWIG